MAFGFPLEVNIMKSTVIVLHVLLKSWLILAYLAALFTLLICDNMNICDVILQIGFVFKVFPTVRADEIFLISMNPSNVTF